MACVVLAVRHGDRFSHLLRDDVWRAADRHAVRWRVLPRDRAHRRDVALLEHLAGEWNIRQVSGTSGRWVEHPAGGWNIRQVSGTSSRWVEHPAGEWNIRQVSGTSGRWVEHPAGGWNIRQVSGTSGRWVEHPAGEWNIRQVSGTSGRSVVVCLFVCSFIHSSVRRCIPPPSAPHSCRMPTPTRSCPTEAPTRTSSGQFRATPTSTRRGCTSFATSTGPRSGRSTRTRRTARRDTPTYVPIRAHTPTKPLRLTRLHFLTSAGNNEVSQKVQL